MPLGAKIRGVTGVLLAGGKSRRMGQDKRFLDVGGESLVQRVLRVYEALFEEIIVIVAEESEERLKLGHRVVADLIPGCGSLGGLYTGLVSSANPKIFAAACDMPFLNQAVIRELARVDEDYDIVMVRLRTGLQPMHAVYKTTCLPHFKAMIEAHRLTIQDVINRPGLRVKIIPEDDIRHLDAHLRSFLNVNTPADLEFARKFTGDAASGSAPG